MTCLELFRVEKTIFLLVAPGQESKCNKDPYITADN